MIVGQLMKIWWYSACDFHVTVECHYNECHYNTVQYNMILHKSFHLLRQIVNQRLKPQKMPRTSPWRVSYGVSVMNTLEKIDRVIMVLYCSIPDSKAHGANMGPTWALSAPDGPHVGPLNLTIRDSIVYGVMGSQSIRLYRVDHICLWKLN